ncbi:MAG: ABC transporter permease, partial [Clostridia bacterium]
MTAKLALRNITSKPLRSVATIIAIALAVAMIFCMLSFKSAVYEYIFATETADVGNSDIIVTYNSSGDRLTDTAPLQNVEGIKTVTPVLSLFAMLGDEYVRVRGFESGKICNLQNITVIEGSIDDLNSANDNIAISKKSAEHFGFKIGSAVTLKLGNNAKDFYVAVIADSDGYFLGDSPFVFLGTSAEGVARLIQPAGYAIYNEIYVTAKDGVDKTALKDTISNLSAYEKMQVDFAQNSAYIEEKTVGLTAPIVVAGAAIVVIALACIILLFMMSEKDKINYMSQLTVVGATRKQMFSIFLVESLILSIIGAAVGAAVASGLFVGLLKFTLSSTVTFSVSAVKLLGSLGLGVVVSVLASLAPLGKAFRSSVRENQIDTRKKRKNVAYILPLILMVLTLICVVLEFTVKGLKGSMSIVNLILAFLTLGVSAGYALKGTAKVTEKASEPSVKVASVSILREKRFVRSVTMLTVGMLASMALFMAWSLTTNVFNSYLNDFKNIVFVTNVQADVDTAGFTEIDGVKSASALVWRTGTIAVGGTDKSINVLGSVSALDLLDFKYHTPRSVIDERMKSGKPYCVLDYAMSELYGAQEGDTIKFTVDNKERDFIVAGIVEHTLFSGNYVITSVDIMDTQFGLKVDTVLVTIDGDVAKTVGAIREKYAQKNFYVVEALEAYRWDQQSMGAVFDLIG